MKKIININLSGRVIPIEDSAYEKLQGYIESLRRYFAHEDGRDEIINDIESRIAELLNEKVRKGAAAITDADIDEIAASMGRPEDFEKEEREEADAPKQTTAGNYSYSETKTKKRLYRDSSDKFIGGVCSGIANYLNVDPAIVRILFAIITFGGLGVGFVIYILLWILLPDKDLDDYTGKRLYRNPDDRVLGGVAGGLAAYFDTRTSTIRLIFAAPFLISLIIAIINGLTWHTDFGNFFPNIIFGSLGSTFILAYIILWIVLPEARSTYEKMEMRGEKVDVKTISQNMKDRMKEWSEEVKESAERITNKTKEFTNTKAKPFAAEVGQTARRAGSGVGHAIGVLFKVFFLFIAGSIAFGLFVALMALIFGGIAWWPVNNYLWTSNWQQAAAWGTLIFFLLVPLVAFFIWLIRRIVGVRSRNSYLGWIFGSLWVIGWVSVIFFAASMFRDFSEYGSVNNPITTSQPANGKMIVTVSEPQLEYKGRFDWFDDMEVEGWDLSDDTARLSTIKFTIRKSNDDLYHVTLWKHSRGRNETDAQVRAEKIRYSVSSLDSVLDLGNGYTIDKESKFRMQQVEIEIRVPAGKKIYFDHSVLEKLNPADFRRSRRHSSKTTINGRVIRSYSYDDRAFPYQTGVEYTMGIDGKLKDPAGRVIDQYNYNWYDPSTNNTNDTLNLKQQLEEEKRQREEKDKKIKEIEDKLKGSGSGSTGAVEVLTANDDRYAVNTLSPVFSLTKTFF